jgi:hypothetical protein
MKTLIAGAIAATLLLGCAQMPGMPGMSGTPSRTSESIVTASALVEAVDYDTRTVQLRDDANGESFTVVAGDEVRNLDQVQPGDRVELDYYESVAVGMALPEDSGESITSVVTGRAPEGALPGGLAAVTTSLVVQFISYDPNTALATYVAPDGITRRSTVPPDLRTFAEQRRRGDRIVVTVTEAVAVGITEAG